MAPLSSLAPPPRPGDQSLKLINVTNLTTSQLESLINFQFCILS